MPKLAPVSLMVLLVAGLGCKAEATTSAETQPEVSLGAPFPAHQGEVLDVSSLSQGPERKGIAARGQVQRVCQNKGCWMELSDADTSLRVTFKDYGFFVPQNINGKWALLFGDLVAKRVDPKTVAHLRGEGASFPRLLPDGSAEEYQFVASSVQLHPEKPKVR